MAWTLLMADEDGTALAESSLIFDEEVVDYLSRLPGSPYLRGLKGLDRQEETWIDPEAREALAAEVAELSARVERREVPEPPAWVGMEGTGDLRVGEELGWRGLLDLLRRMEHLLHLCRTLKLELWMVPDS
jgi:hypothetical protein